MRPRRPHPMTPQLALGLRLREFRQRRGWTQEGLAHRAGLSIGFVGRIEIDSPTRK
jgi:transcriptional regulator with XRE-family HTH domain